MNQYLLNNMEMVDEKIVPMLMQILERLSAVETRVDTLYNRHNTTEGYFVQAVFLVILAAIGFVWYLVRKRDK